MCQDLRIGIAGKRIPFAFEHRGDRPGILYDTVVNESDRPVLRPVRMRVAVARLTVCRPARMPDTDEPGDIAFSY